MSNADRVNVRTQELLAVQQILTEAYNEEGVVGLLKAYPLLIYGRVPSREIGLRVGRKKIVVED